MFKRLYRYSSFSKRQVKAQVEKILTLTLTSTFLFIFASCAPKVAPPPLYRDLDLTLEQIVPIVSKDIHTIKAILSMNIEKADNPYLYADASVLLKRPDWLHIRLYKFGIPVGNFLVKDDVVYNLSGRGNSELNDKLLRNLKEFSKNLYLSVFWWDALMISDCGFQIADCKGNTVMFKNETEYVIRAENREIHLDNTTLLLRSQEIIVNDKKIYILYEEPKEEGDFWYPSTIKAETGNHRVTINVKKLFINPSLEEGDFKVPQDNM